MKTPEWAPPRRRPAIIWRPARALLMALCALALAACSVVTLGYNRLPTLAYWWVDSRLDLTDAQTPLVRAELDQLLDWHRRTQLPRMAATLRDWQALAAGPVQASQICAQLPLVQAWADSVALQVIERLGPLAASLEPRQIDHLQRHQSESNRDFRRDYLAQPEDALQARVERTTDRLELLYGTLNAAQEQALREGLRRSGFDAATALAETEQRQAALRGLLRAAAPGGTSAAADATAGLRGLWTELVQPSAPAAKARREARLQASCDWLAAVHNAATPAQRQRAQETLRGYERDFTALSQARP